jgi:anti-anti-sigma factor
MIFIGHTEEMEGRVAVVEVRGGLTGENCGDLDDYIGGIIAAGKTYIIFDAKKMEYISSGGIGAILYIHKNITSAGGIFIMFGLSDEVRSLFELIGFDKIITLAGMRAEAIDMASQMMNAIGPDKNNDQTAEKPVPENNTREAADGNPQFENPLIVECSGCKGLVRVKKSGNFVCPDCQAEFTVEKDQTIIF